MTLPTTTTPTTTQSSFSLKRAFANHSGAFLTSLAIGVMLTLGVRSMFLGGDAPPAMAGTSTASDRQAAPGEEGDADDARAHEGHARDGASAPADDKDDAKADTDGERADADADADKGKAGHGKAGHAKDSDKDGGKGKAADKAKPKFVSVLLNLGNEACPVMGGDVNGKTFTEWNGLRVGHCCPGCEKRFLKNPESLLDEVSPKWRDAAAAVKAINTAEGKARAALIKKTAETWTVVREPVGTKAPAPAPGLLVDVGNAACPVMGGDVDGKTFTEWNGLRVGHCCPGCSKRFLANPEALLDEVAPKWRDAAAGIKSVNAAEGAAQKQALAKLKKTWTVVREPAAKGSK